MDLPALSFRAALVDLRVPILQASHMPTLHSRSVGFALVKEMAPMYSMLDLDLSPWPVVQKATLTLPDNTYSFGPLFNNLMIVINRTPIS